jgi:hypothetical protein
LRLLQHSKGQKGVTATKTETGGGGISNRSTKGSGTEPTGSGST